jgi:acetylornithine deacetylase (EC 3.5.1.16)/N2-acetyl-L-lysine deacetylase (EC 3.5.1.-)
MCIIGEPSGSDGITLGYKGRLLIQAHIERASQHTAIPEPSVSELAVALWNHVRALADAWNADSPGLSISSCPPCAKYNRATTDCANGATC